ncbi:MAG TPA: hypothetical protein VFV40_00200 [Nocardioides sp.]|nr:hypothetical protein [Nocardioides sp.]
MHRQPLLQKGFVLALGAVLLLIAVLLPLAQRLDAGVDVRRPLYEDVMEVAAMEYLAVKSDGHPTAVTVGPHETVEIGGESFTPTEGVTVEVRRDGIGYCVRAGDEDGRQTGWQCYDGLEDPAHRGEGL